MNRLTYVGNCLLYLDLYLMIKSPFYPRAARIKYYVATLVTVAMATVILFKIVNKNNDEADEFDNPIVMYPVLVVSALVVFTLNL